MNTADRSIALLDTALRRRFAFHEIMPNPALLSDTVVQSESDSVDLEKLLVALNQHILKTLGRDYQIGHSYFLRVANKPEDERLDELEYVWNNQILPLLEEYYYGRRDILAGILSGSRASNENDPYVDFDRLQGENLLRALYELQLRAG
jgi:5-methylcytosine-specific restriction protein B